MKKEKFIVTGAVVGSLMLTQCVFGAEYRVTPSHNALSVQSGEIVNKVNSIPSYIYQNSNYFMLRDVGKIVGYQVDWAINTKQITLKKDKNFQNLKGLSIAKQAENINGVQQTVVIDGQEYKNLECLNIDGYNYFKLRDLSKIMDFTCDWDDSTNTIVLTLDKQNISETPNTPETNISIDRFLDPDLEQKIIKDDVVYVSGTTDYTEIETYIQNNIDKDFKVRDYLITEDNYNGLLPGYNQLIMKLDVNGVSANYGYLVTCLNNKAALITFIGEKNTEFDATNIDKQQLSDDEAKQKAIEADGYNYKVDEQRIYRFFDMKDLKNKCEVETVYIDDCGNYFATSHIF